MANYSIAGAMRSIPVDIEIRMGTHNHRIRGLWVGQREGEYLIIDLPKRYNWLDIQNWFTNCTAVVLRGVLREGQVFAASTQFIGLVPRPFRQLILSAPDSMQERSLHKVPRVAVDIDAKLTFTKELPRPKEVPEHFDSLAGRVTDLSLDGIAFESVADVDFPREAFLGQLADMVFVGQQGKTVAQVIGEIKSCRQAGDKLFQFGLAIDTKNRDYRASLGALILSSKHIQAMLQDND